MGDDARERLRRRLQRYRQHHEASSCRYDNHINTVTEHQREQTKILHMRWLESQDGIPRKKLKVAVVDDGAVASTSTSMTCHTSESLLSSTTANCVVLPTDAIATSKLQTSSVDSTCCVDISNGAHVSCPSVPASDDCLQPTVGSIISDCDSGEADIRGKVISNACESTLEDYRTSVCCEASAKTLSNTETSCDTVITCQASYCIL